MPAYLVSRHDPCSRQNIQNSDDRGRRMFATLDLRIHVALFIRKKARPALILIEVAQNGDRFWSPAGFHWGYCNLLTPTGTCIERGLFNQRSSLCTHRSTPTSPFYDLLFPSRIRTFPMEVLLLTASTLHICGSREELLEARMF